MNNKPYGLYFLYLWLFFFAFIPLMLVFIASFLSRDSHHLVNLPFTWQNYANLCTVTFGKIFFRSLLLAGTATLLCLVLAYPFSYLLIKSPHQSLLLLLLIIPFWTSSLIRTYALVALLKYKGVINTLLLQLHLIALPMNLLYTHFAVAVGLIYTLFPFMVLPIFSNMERFDFRLIEAAQDLGVNRWSVFTRVFLPNTLPGIVAGCLFVLLPAMTLFYIPNVLGGARSILLGNLIQNQFLSFANWPQGAATSMVLTSLLLGLLFIFRRMQGEILR